MAGIDRARIPAIYVFHEPVIIGFGYFVVHEALFPPFDAFFLLYPSIVFKRLLKGNECKEEQQNY